MVQAGTQALYSAFLLRLWNLFVLHDDLQGFISSRTLMGSRNKRSEVWGKFAHRPTTYRILGEGCPRDQKQQ